MHIAVGNDHAGLPLKKAVIDKLVALGHQVTDLGTNETKSVDYPDYAKQVGLAVQSGEAERGILICGSGIGMAIAANKLHGVRASVVHDTYGAAQGVEHDALNVLCLGSRVIGEAVAEEIIEHFVAAKFTEEERFIRRMLKVGELEKA